MAANVAAKIESSGRIWLQGVRTRNLREISVDFPANSLVVVTGVSGAGKTSLAVSTLAAEGQRRFIETFPTAARRFLERLERPDCDQIGPLPPAIIHRHHLRPAGRRSTVATLSDVSATLQQLFSAAGQIFCPRCQIPVVAHSALSVAEFVASLSPDQRFQLAFDYSLDAATIADKAASDLLESGFQRIIVNEQSLTLKVPLPPDWPSAVHWTVVVDRLRAGRVSFERLVDSLEIAMQRGGGSCVIILQAPPAQASKVVDAKSMATLDGEPVERITFHTRPICSRCQTQYQPLNPRHFSFNSPAGACPACQGLGTQQQSICPDCHGNRLRPESLSVRCGTRSFRDVISLTVEGAARLCPIWSNELPELSRQIAGPPLQQLRQRFELLERLGLGYLALNRSGPTLSSGESQRLSLAATCAADLVNSMYVLEEPASGMHPQEVQRLLDVLFELKEQRNTILVTEHVGDVIRSADVVIDLGPGAGPEGGAVTYQGGPIGFVQHSTSITSQFLRDQNVASDRKIRSPAGWLSLTGVHFRNLIGIDIDFPLGTLCAVTGVSGSGKSSLIRDTLFPALSARLQQPIDSSDVGRFRNLDGTDALQSVMYVDQTALEKSSRGNVATASNLWPEIRAILAETPEAKLRQFTPGTFSFYNANGGRCPHCEGRGTLAIDLQFLADLTVTCPECGGTRFQREVLDVKYRGHHVAEILGLTVTNALPFFRGKSRLQRRLKALKDVGLGFLQLGQPVSSLSGGETQRLKLAARMMAKPAGATLFLLDEPARGLHPADIQGLVTWFNDLLNEGHSFIVIEHRQELIRVADHVIELGPGAGPSGGRIIRSEAGIGRLPS